MMKPILLSGAFCVFTAMGGYAQVAWNTVPEFTTYTDATNPVKSDGTNLLQGAEYSEWIANNSWVELPGGPFSSYSGNQFTVGNISYKVPTGRGDSQWMGQLRLNTNYSIQQGKKYSVTFHVKSSAANKFTIKIEDVANGDNSFYYTYVTLPANQECLFVINDLPAPTTINQASIVFDAGGAAVGSTIDITDLNIQGEAGSPAGGPMTLTGAPEGYELVWSDEFDEDSLTTKWNPMTWNAGNVNNELQTYRPGSQSNRDINGQIRHTAEVKDGKLVITAFKGSDGKIYSARMDSHQKGSGLEDYAAWKYGYMEARLKLPKGKGTWPAFWMMPVGVNWTDEQWPRCGEIDIMEEVGADPNTCVCSLHAEGHYHANNTQVSASKHVDNMEGGWVTYAMLWDNDNISMYADGQRILSYNNDHNGYVNWPYDRPYYITLNLAWGGDWGGYKGVDETALPAEFEVDYVRVYQIPETRSLASDGTGTVFVQGPYNGLAKDGVVPSSTFNSSIGNYYAVEGKDKVYTYDFVVGKNLDINRGQFGFRSEPDAPASKSFTPAGRTYRARLLENPYLVMDANGNMSIRKDAPVKEGDMLTVKLDLTNGVNDGIITAGPYDPSGINTPMISEVADAHWFDLTGRMLQSEPTIPGIYIHGNKKVIVK